MMKTDDFDYSLPTELIAQKPLSERGASRLLVVEEEGVTDKYFSDLPTLLNPGDLLVMNDTRVIPARLYLTKASGGRVEVMLERFVDECHFLALARSNKTLKPGTQLWLGNQSVVEFIERDGVFFRFRVLDGIEGEKLFIKNGHIPLPPYINRPDSQDDHDRYQTVYAENSGAVAAPTAGLHFDESLLDQITQIGVDTARVTLHVGAGTFQPVKVDDVTQHVMHREWVEVPKKTVDKIRITHERGGRVIAVGTTTVRALESAVLKSGAEQPEALQPYSGDTQLFIYPGYSFAVVDAMITNFHLPKSTLLMMISAFSGKQTVMQAYQHAIEGRYRFFSYGDAMMLTKKPGNYSART